MRSIVDNTPLVSFLILDRLDLLRELLGEVWIPPAVAAEFIAFGDERSLALADRDWIRVVDDFEVREFSIRLGAGEREVLSLALACDPSLIVLDDRKARQVALQLGLPLTGSLGLLLRARQRGLIASVRVELEKLQEANLYLDSKLVQVVLSEAGEAS